MEAVIGVYCWGCSEGLKPPVGVATSKRNQTEGVGHQSFDSLFQPPTSRTNRPAQCAFCHAYTDRCRHPNRVGPRRAQGSPCRPARRESDGRAESARAAPGPDPARRLRYPSSPPPRRSVGTQRIVGWTERTRGQPPALRPPRRGSAPHLSAHPYATPAPRTLPPHSRRWRALRRRSGTIARPRL